MYRILPSPEGDRAVPAGGPRQAAAKIAWTILGRTRLLGPHFCRAFDRLLFDPAAPSVRLPFAEAHFGRALAVEIDPGRLGRYLPDVVADGLRAVRLAHWFLDGGDWSPAILPLAGSEVDREVEALFTHDGDLAASPAYERLFERMASGAPDIRNGVALDSRERIDAYFDQYRRLRDSMRQHGFAARHEVPRAVAQAFSGSLMRGPGAERREREVGLAIGRSGELIRMVGGRHRTAIAQRLGLARMPAQVRLVHVGWLHGWVVATGLEPDQAVISGIRAVAAAHGRLGA